MAFWVGVVSAEFFADEVLYARDYCDVRGHGLDQAVAGQLRRGDPVVLVAATEPAVVFGLGTVRGWFGYGPAPSADDVRAATRGIWQTAVAYTRRVFEDSPTVAAAALAEAGVDPLVPGLSPLTEAGYQGLVGGLPTVPAPGDPSEWFVSLTLPIEASSPAEAVREFWSYVEKLGPRELPTYVWPRGDELSMQAFVLGATANLDPEEDD